MRRVVHGVRELAVGEIPIVVIAGMQRGFAQLGFVIGQILGDLVLVEQGLFLAVELGLGGEVGTEFAGHRRLYVRLFLGVEEGGELVELFLADGIVLVVVALRAAHREAHPHGAQGCGAIQHLFVAELLRVGAAFAIGERIAVEAGGDQGIEIALGEQVAGKLLDGELVEGQIAIQRVDDPLAVAPRPGARAIFFVAIAIRVARQVEPVARPLLAVVRGIEQPVHIALVGVGARVGGEFAYLFGSGRQAGEVETDAAQQGELGGFGRGRDALLFQAGEDEIVDFVARPGAIAHRGRRGPLNFLEAPVRGAGGPLHALIDPGAQQSDLVGGEVRAHRRHEFVAGPGDAQDEAALRALARDDVLAGGAPLEGGLLGIQAQAAHLLLRAVAGVAAFGEQRFDIAGEFDFGGGGRRQRRVGGVQRRKSQHNDKRPTQCPQSEHRTYYIPAGAKRGQWND